MNLATAMTRMQIKKTSRQKALEARSNIAASRDGSAAALRLKDNFFSAFDVQANQSVAAYWPFRDEIDVRPLFAALEVMGCNCLLPVMMGRREPLQFYQWKPGDELEASRFGVLEPSKFHPSATPDVLILPLLAFDHNGMRLGYGGGYYDRTLSALREKGQVLAIGAAYQDQEVECVPHDNNDQKMDALVTDRSFVWFSSR